MRLTPMYFKPLLMHRIWGGSRLKTLFGKEIPDAHTGESWELSGLVEATSVVAEGEYSGKSLRELMDLLGADLLGTEVLSRYGTTFPLLFKFIDATEDLSVQLHPDDERALRRHQALGKTEAWYIVHADPGAKLVSGLKRQLSTEALREVLQNGSLSDELELTEVHAGEVYYLPAGTLHAIGKGIVLAEVQQSSDITYRVFDWNRVDKNGKARDLHVEEALEALKPELKVQPCLYSHQVNQLESLVKGPYFEIQKLEVEGAAKLHTDLSRFAVLMCVSGSVQLQADDYQRHLQAGDTLLIPANCANLQLQGNGRCLWVTPC